MLDYHEIARDDGVDFEVECVPPGTEGVSPSGQHVPSRSGGASGGGPAMVASDPAYLRRFKGRLFGSKSKSTKATAMGPTGLSFNYEDMYEEDKYGEEVFADARVWKVYNDEAQLSDMERIEAWRDAVDVILVFIGLFAAVVSAFLIETTKTLQPDYLQITAVVSFEILRYLNSSVLPHPTLSPDILDPRFGQAAPTRDNNLVNILWYTSLTLSLSAALLAMLIKQWLHQYMSFTSGTARERARIRHFRYVGLEKYHVPLIINLLPTLLHLALGLFLIGLAINLKALHTVMFYLVVGIAAGPFTFYLVSTILPLIDTQCPYKSPPSFYIYQLPALLRLLMRQLWWLIKSIAVSVAAVYRHCVPANEDTITFEEGDNDNIRLPDDSVAGTGASDSSLSEAEKQAVLKNSAQLDVDGLVHLYKMSSNTHVRSIVLQASGGLPVSTANTKGIESVIGSDLHSVIRQCCHDGDSDNRPIQGMEHRHERLIRSLCICSENPSNSYNLSMQYFQHGEMDPRRVFSKWISPRCFGSWRNGVDWEDSNLAAIFAFASQHSFPLSVWATLIRQATLSQQNDYVIRAILVATLHLPHDTTEMGAVSVARAMQNPLIRTIGLGYLGVTEQESERVYAQDGSALLSLSLSSGVDLLSRQNATYLEDTARDFCRLSLPNPISTSGIPHLLSTGLPFLFRSLVGQRHLATLSGREIVDLEKMDIILTEFFGSPHLEKLSWETHFSAVQAWNALPERTIKAITTPRMIRRVLGLFRGRGLPDKEHASWIRMMGDSLRGIFSACLDVQSRELCEAILSEIQNFDILPVDLDTRPEYTALLLLWSPYMCRMLSDRTCECWRAGMAEGWFDSWLSYMHVPERLTFLCSKLASLERNSLDDLCKLRPMDPSWPTVFATLLRLLDSQAHLDSIAYDGRDVRLQQPRRWLSRELQKMKTILVEHHSVLSTTAFDIPQVDADDTLIANSSTNHTETRPEPLPDQTVAVSVQENHHRESTPDATQDDHHRTSQHASARQVAPSDSHRIPISLAEVGQPSRPLVATLTTLDEGSRHTSVDMTGMDMISEADTGSAPRHLHRAEVDVALARSTESMAEREHSHG